MNKNSFEDLIRKVFTYATTEEQRKIVRAFPEYFDENNVRNKENGGSSILQNVFMKDLHKSANPEQRKKLVQCGLLKENKQTVKLTENQLKNIINKAFNKVILEDQQNWEQTDNNMFEWIADIARKMGAEAETYGTQNDRYRGYVDIIVNGKSFTINSDWEIEMNYGGETIRIANVKNMFNDNNSSDETKQFIRFIKAFIKENK